MARSVLVWKMLDPRGHLATRAVALWDDVFRRSATPATAAEALTRALRMAVALLPEAKAIEILGGGSHG